MQLQRKPEHGSKRIHQNSLSVRWPFMFFFFCVAAVAATFFPAFRHLSIFFGNFWILFLTELNWTRLAAKGQSKKKTDRQFSVLISSEDITMLKNVQCAKSEEFFAPFVHRWIGDKIKFNAFYESKNWIEYITFIMFVSIYIKLWTRKITFRPKIN